MDMSDRKTWKRYGGAAGLVASGLVAGGVLAGTLSANAAEDTTAGTEGSTGSSAEDTRPQRPVEETLTGDVRSGEQPTDGTAGEGETTR
jgi:hypothetical protein